MIDSLIWFALGAIVGAVMAMILLALMIAGDNR